MKFIKLCSQHMCLYKSSLKLGASLLGAMGRRQAAALGLVLGCLGGAASGDGGRAGYVPAVVVSCC